MRWEQNPADYSLRGIRANENEKLERWKNGPEFLWKAKEEWPQQPKDIQLDEYLDDIVVGSTAIQEPFWSTLFHKYSSWSRLRRIVAWLILLYSR